MHTLKGRGGVVLHLWNEWAVYILVLVSLSLQVFLFVFGGTHRRSCWALLRVLLWLSYLGADTTATYTIGHLSIISGSRTNQLMAFWAPFVLLHLGGQDTITAYALEDNRLWLRHLQTLVLQVLGVAYVLYRYISGSGTLVAATILMFIVGVVKYAERIWALRCSKDGMKSLFKEHKNEATSAHHRRRNGNTCNLFLEDAMYDLKGFKTEEEEVVMYRAHILVGAGLCLFLEIHGTRYETPHQKATLAYLVDNNKICKVVQMELSLLYDLLYTKASVVCTRYGLCIRVVSLLSIVATLFLFQFGGIIKDGYSKVDVAVTYILLVGAFLLEVTSGLMAIRSTWSRHFLYMRRWTRLYNVLVYLGWLHKEERWRSWSGRVGQFNLVDYTYTFTAAHRWLYQSKVEEEKFVPPPPAQITPQVELWLMSAVLWIAERHKGILEGVYSLNHNSDLPALDTPNPGFDTRIIGWHIATDLILGSISNRDQYVLKYKQAVKMVSDYIMFLLVKDPAMLPGHSLRKLYTDTLYDLGKIIPYKTREELVQCLLDGCYVRTETDDPNNAFDYGVELAKGLLGKQWNTCYLLEQIFGVWVEMMCYAANNCSKDTHARMLGSGGEWLTVVWLLMGHVAWYKRDVSIENA